MQGLAESLFPRSSKLAGLNQFNPRALLGAGLDVASLPGRAYASLGRMDDETYMQALGRTSPRYVVGQGEGDEMADAILRDPSLPIGAVGSAWKGLGRIGRAVVDAGIGAGTGAADQYSQGRKIGLGELLGGAAIGVLPSVVISGKTPVSRMAGEITPEQRAANFKNWFGDSKVVDADGKPLVVYHGMPPKFETIGGNRKLSQEERAAYLSECVVAHNKAKDAIRSLGIDENAYQILPEEQKATLDAIYASRNLERNAIDSKYGQGIPYKIEQLNAVNQLEGTAFDPMRSSDVGTHFSENPEVASRFAKTGSVFPVYLSGEVVDMPDVFSRYQGLSDAAEAFREAGVISKKDAERLSRMATKADGIDFPDERDWGASKDVLKFWEEARKASAGSKKIIRYNNDVEGGGKSYAVFDPTQIKSATGNRGTFDPTDPNITHFAGRTPTARQSTPIQALGNRLSAGARNATVRKYLSDGRQEQVGGPVPTGLGGFLMASPGDTPYTRRTR